MKKLNGLRLLVVATAVLVLGLFIGLQMVNADPPTPIIDGSRDAVYSSSGQIVPMCDTTNQWPVGTLYVYTDTSAVYVYYEQDKSLVDNTYGTNAIGWPSGHTFGNLTGSDKAEFRFTNGSGTVVLDMVVDYMSASASFPSGYGSLGVSGGDGSMKTGLASWVVGATTSLDYNFNVWSYVLTTNSPATDANYTPNPSYPNWIFEDAYELKIAMSAFGGAGFGGVTVPSVHNSPAKVGGNENNPGSCPAAIGDFVWGDSDGDGVQDAGEPGVSGVTVKLYDGSNNLKGTTTTGGAGLYHFTGLTPGDYYVQFVAPTGYVFSPKDEGGDDTKDSDADPTTGKTITTSLVAAEDDLTWDAGLMVNPLCANAPTIDGFRDAVYTQTIPIPMCETSTTSMQGMRVGTLYVYTDACYVYVYYEQDKSLVDNTYGTNAIGWPSGHTFGNLTGSDKAQFRFTNGSGAVVLDMIVDYMTASSSFPSGYGSLGVSGGDGSMKTGLASWVVGATTSLDYNFNVWNYVLTTNSPATDANYTPNSSYPNWIFEDAYELKIDKGVFGTAGFGGVTVPSVHNSPSKWGYNESKPGPCEECALGDFVWNDLNVNGVQDTGETGISGVTVKLYDGLGNFKGITTTDGNGFYHFTDLTPGDYYVQFVVPSGYVFSPKDQGSDDTKDSDADPTTGRTATTNLISGENDTTWDAGLYSSNQICNTLQPGPAAGKDTYIKYEKKDDNFGNDTSLMTDSEEAAKGPIRTLIQFDLSSIPITATIVSSDLSLYLYSNSGSQTDVVEAHRLTRNWVEGTGGTNTGATWRRYDGTNNWTEGGDYDGTVAGSFVASGQNVWKTMSLKDLTQDWVDGTYPNYGVILLSPPASGNNEKKYRSSDYTSNPSQLPKLRVCYEEYAEPTSRGSIGDRVWYDQNGDGFQTGSWDQEGFEDVTVCLYRSDGNQYFEPGVPGKEELLECTTTVTNTISQQPSGYHDGTYGFDMTLHGSGEYFVWVIESTLPQDHPSAHYGWTATTSNPQKVTYYIDTDDLSIDFGFEPSGPPTAVTLSSFAARSSAGGLASPLWLGLAGLTMLAAGSLFWAKRRAG